MLKVEARVNAAAVATITAAQLILSGLQSSVLQRPGPRGERRFGISSVPLARDCRAGGPGGPRAGTRRVPGFRTPSTPNSSVSFSSFEIPIHNPLEQRYRRLAHTPCSRFRCKGLSSCVGTRGSSTITTRNSLAPARNRGQRVPW